jgi:hypothetical protein
VYQSPPELPRAELCAIEAWRKRPRGRRVAGCALIAGLLSAIRGARLAVVDALWMADEWQALGGNGLSCLTVC